ncbi:flavodoxin family protein [soil metagenome]
MSAVVVYESMFGATRQVAEAIARGIGRHTDVTLLNVNDAGIDFPVADLVLVGGPTHVHGLSSPTTRAEAVVWSKDSGRNLTLEKGAPGIGVREWLEDVTGTPGEFVAFDTRADAAALLTGSAAKHIEKALKRAGGHAHSEARSFLVHDNVLNPAELEQAEEFGELLAGRLVSS